MKAFPYLTADARPHGALILERWRAEIRRGKLETAASGAGDLSTEIFPG